MPESNIVALDALPMTAAPAPGSTPVSTPGNAPENCAPAGEPAWDGLATLGSLTVYPRTTPDQLVDRLQGATAALTNKVVFSADTIAKLPDLKYIGLTSTGVNVVDLAAATQAGITVTNVPGYSTDSVAQHTFAMILAMLNQAAEHSASVHAGDWANQPDFSYTLSPLTELAGKTLLVVGMGSIGRQVAIIGHALGMKIIAANQRSKDTVNAMPEIARLNVQWGELDTLLPGADIVSLNCPLTEATQDLINTKRLQTMKQTAIVVNTGRGPLIDEAALATALKENRLGGAALDVLRQEPPEKDNPLVGCPNCIITPHVAWATQAARCRLMGVVTDNLAAYLKGERLNVVN